MKRAAANGNIRRRSAVRGRERWEIEALFRKPALAGRVQTDLSEEEGIIRVAANPLTGRVLILFDPNIVGPGRVGEMIHSVVQLIFREIPARENPAPGEAGKEAQGGIDENDLLKLIRAADFRRRHILKAFGISLIHTMLKIAAPLTFGFIMVVSLSRPLAPLARLGFRSRISQVWALSGMFIVLRALEAWAEKHRRTSWSANAYKVEQILRLRAFETAMGLDMAYVDNQSTDKLTALITADTDKIKKFMDYTPPTILEKSLTLLIGGGLILFVSPPAFLLALLPLPVVYLLNKRFQKEITKKYGDNSVYMDRFNRILSNSLQGFATIKSFTSEKAEIDRLADAGEALLDNSNDIEEEIAKFSGNTNFAFAMAICVPLIYGGIGLIRGTMPLFSFIALSSTLPLLLTATTGLDHANTYYQEARSSAKRLLDFMAVQARIVSGRIRISPEKLRGNIVFTDVVFSYAEEPVLDGVALDIRENQTVAFVGPTGSGKSTITKLLLRFYDVNRGRITLDGVDVRDLDLQDLRTAVGMVSQDVFLFNGTVYENILYGRPDASREEVIEAARAAEAHEFIAELTDGYDAWIGERGMKLSGGQRQRISIARTILKNPPVLILDEATSSVDNETEAAIQASIKRISRNRVTIMIAHRLSTIRHADRIYVLKKGCVVEKGAHDELLEANGEYASLWNMQIEEAEGEDADENHGAKGGRA